MILKRRRVRRWAQECWTEGFFWGVGGIPDTGRFSEGPRWWQDVKDIAGAAGFEYAQKVIADREERPLIPKREIPADVLAECYAAAIR